MPKRRRSTRTVALSATPAAAAPVRLQLAGTLALAHATDTAAAPSLTGVLLTYGRTSDPSGTGDRVRMVADSVRLPAGGVPLMREHELTTAAAGVLTELTRDGDELLGRFELLDTSTGRDTLAELRAGVRTELSVGLAVLDHERDDTGALVVLDAELVEVSQVLRGAMPGARVTDIAATAAATDTPEDAPVTTDTAAPAVEAPTGGEVAAPVILTAPAPLARPSIGEYLYANLRRREEPELYARLAAPHTFVGDVPGIVPELIVGDVIAGRPSSRPIFDSLGAKAGPTGASFVRPLISDPLLDAASATEKTDVTDQLKVTAVTVTYEPLKRAANVSFEAVAATSPEVLGVVATDLVRAYLRGAEKFAAAELLATDGTATAAANVGAIYTAAATQYGATGELPDTLAVGPAAWAKIAAALPNVNITNGVGTNVGASAFGLTLAGLRVVVSWALPGTIGYLYSTQLVESWEGAKVTMRADEPTILGVALGIAGQVAISVPMAAAVTALDLATFA